MTAPVFKRPASGPQAAPMPPTVYNVVNRDGRWTMVINHNAFGAFATKTEAVRIAIDTAYAAGRFGHIAAVVVLHEPDAIAQIVWTYGYDPFPPTQYE